jgi:hypothetical protein
MQGPLFSGVAAMMQNLPFLRHTMQQGILDQYNEKRRWAFLTAAEHFPNPLGAAFPQSGRWPMEYILGLVLGDHPKTGQA